MGKWFKYKLAWGILFIAFSLTSYKVNLSYGERRVSFFEGMLYLFQNSNGKEWASSTIDQIYLFTSLGLIFLFFLVRKNIVIIIILFACMLAILLGYAPFVFDEHPEIGF